MREIVEFRIPEEWACEWLQRSDGKVNRTGSVRVVKAPRGSELYERVVAIDREWRKADRRFFFTYSIDRAYDPTELEQADILLLHILNVFEPPGEEFDVVYLPDIHGPAEFMNRVGPLILQCSRFRGNSFSETIAGERLISPEVQKIVRDRGFTGVEFGPVICNGQPRVKTDWAELVVTSPKVAIAPPTVVGTNVSGDPPPDVWDETTVHLGLNVLSEVSIRRDSWDGSDFAVSWQTVGAHQGLLRPYRLLFISKRLFGALSPKMRRALKVEVASLV
jgi:hypothetical protein